MGSDQTLDLLRHCEYALAVVDEGSFTDAAIALGITQPPLSQGVRRLEDRWGVRLFDRSPRGVDLTPAGRRLLPTMRALIADARTLDHRARELGAAAGQPVCGIDRALGAFADEVLACWYREAGAPIRPHVDGPDRLIAAVRDGEIDVALLLHPCAVDGLLCTQPIVVPTEVALPEGTAVAAGAVPRDLPLALPPRAEAPAAHDVVVHEAQRMGHNGEVLEVDGDPRAWVSSGAAWSLVPRPRGMARPAPQRLQLRAVVVARDAAVLSQVHSVAERVAAYPGHG